MREIFSVGANFFTNAFNSVVIIQALDQDYNEANRQNCALAAQSLIDAVDTLCNFASSPEFASVPAKISSKVVI